MVSNIDHIICQEIPVLVGISAITTVTQRDVQSQGFPEEFLAKAHGVFLDLPEPWKVSSLGEMCH